MRVPCFPLFSPVNLSHTSILLDGPLNTWPAWAMAAGWKVQPGFLHHIWVFLNHFVLCQWFLKEEKICWWWRRRRSRPMISMGLLAVGQMDGQAPVPQGSTSPPPPIHNNLTKYMKFHSLIGPKISKWHRIQISLYYKRFWSKVKYTNIERKKLLFSLEKSTLFFFLPLSREPFLPHRLSPASLC